MKPKKLGDVSVIGTTYTVWLYDRIEDHEEELSGICHIEDKRIFVSRRHNKTFNDCLSTIHHELMHAFQAEIRDPEFVEELFCHLWEKHIVVAGKQIDALAAAASGRKSK
jgi:hypothetical protein